MRVEKKRQKSLQDHPTIFGHANQVAQRNRETRAPHGVLDVYSGYAAWRRIMIAATTRFSGQRTLCSRSSNTRTVLEDVVQCEQRFTDVAYHGIYTCDCKVALVARGD